MQITRMPAINGAKPLSTINAARQVKPLPTINAACQAKPLPATSELPIASRAVTLLLALALALTAAAGVLLCQPLANPAATQAHAATTYTEGTLYWENSGGYATITGTFGRQEEVTIPASIAGLPVNAVASQAFYNNPNLKILNVPGCVISFPEDAVRPGVTVNLHYGDTYTLQLTSQADGQRVAFVSGGGTYAYGQQVQISAQLPADLAPFYTFQGWYSWGSLVSAEPDFALKITGNQTLEARYTANSHQQVTLTVAGALPVQVVANGQATLVTQPGTLSVPLGSQLQITYQGTNTLDVWTNGSGRQLGTGSQLELVAVAPYTVAAVTRTAAPGAPGEPGAPQALCLNAYGQVLAVATAADDIPAQGPTKLGYVFAGWSTTEGGAPLTDPWAAVLAGATRLYPCYTPATAMLAVTTSYQTADGQDLLVPSNRRVIGGEAIQLTAPEVEGHVFSHWAVVVGVASAANAASAASVASAASAASAGQPISFQQNLTLSPSADMELVAVYDSDTPAAPTSAILSWICTPRDSGGVRYDIATYYDASPATAVAQAGLLVTATSGQAGSLTLDAVDGATVLRLDSASKDAAGTFVGHVGRNRQGVLWARSFVVLLDGTVIYSDTMRME